LLLPLVVEGDESVLLEGLDIDFHFLLLVLIDLVIGEALEDVLDCDSLALVGAGLGVVEGVFEVLEDVGAAGFGVGTQGGALHLGELLVDLAALVLALLRVLINQLGKVQVLVHDLSVRKILLFSLLVLVHPRNAPTVVPQVALVQLIRVRPLDHTLTLVNGLIVIGHVPGVLTIVFENGC